VDEATADEDEGFDGVLRFLRSLAAPCDPPVGVGTFDVLYASADEIVVWYSPARDGHTPGEVTIPCGRLAAAWATLTAGETLDESALERLGAGLAGGRWLLAVLAQLPGVQMRDDPLVLSWARAPVAFVAPIEAPVSVATAPATATARSRKRKSRAT
jgi:hypothetical protein